MNYFLTFRSVLGFFGGVGGLILVLVMCQLSGCNERDQYTFKAKELCTGEDGLIRYLELDTFQRYGANRPFQIKRRITGDSLLISFKVIQDCCLTPKPKVEFFDNEINVGFQFDNASCACVCDYLFQYGFALSSLESKSVNIR